VPGALLTIAVIALMSWVSWVGVGVACSDGTELHRGTPQGLVCEIQVSHWHEGASRSQAAVDRAEEYLMLVVPVLIVLGGIALGAARHRRRPFWLALTLAIVVLLAPWLALLGLFG
jgi:hypothetical protein